MVQVDVFWSYAIGAGFALAAGNQLRARAAAPARPSTSASAAPSDTPGWLTNPYLVVTLLYAGALFAPSGIWLLWAFPSWETMHAGDRSLPAWLVAAFAITNVTQALLGFLVTQRLLLRGRPRWAYLQMLGGYVGMFFILVHGWDGTGYQRFFSATRSDFTRWHTRAPLANVVAWLTSPVALTLYGMGAVLVPVMLLIMRRWHAGALHRAGAASRSTVVPLTLGSVFVIALGTAICASVIVHLLGPWLGAVVSLAAAWLVLVRRRGVSGWIVGRLRLPQEPVPVTR